MERHTSSQTAQTERVGSCEALDVPPIALHETAYPSPGVDVTTDSPGAGIPFDGSPFRDIREFVPERTLQQLLLDGRPRSRRAAAAVMLRFSRRHGLQVFRLGRTRLYRVGEFFRALERESGIREERLLRRGLHLG
jgi:hypothetical protein